MNSKLYKAIKDRWADYNLLYRRDTHSFGSCWPGYWYIWTGSGWNLLSPERSRQLEGYVRDRSPLKSFAARFHDDWWKADGWLEAVHIDKLTFLVLTGVEMETT